MQEALAEPDDGRWMQASLERLEALRALGSGGPCSLVAGCSVGLPGHDRPVPPTREQRLRRWEARATPWIIVAAILPLLDVFAPGTYTGVRVSVALACWAVFAVDLAVHMRLRPGYLRTGIGVFDAVIVVGTFPWYLIPGASGGAFVVVLRLGRLARLGLVAVKTPAAKHLLRRLGAPALVVAAAVFLAAAIVQHVEGPPEYSSYGESLWWAMVTVTTVGYGDIVPTTAQGQVVAVMLMLVGVILLGTVAASLASFFAETGKPPERAADADGDTPRERAERLQRSLDEARSELEALRASLEQAEPPGA